MNHLQKYLLKTRLQQLVFCNQDIAGRKIAEDFTPGGFRIADGQDHAAIRRLRLLYLRQCIEPLRQCGKAGGLLWDDQQAVRPILAAHLFQRTL